MTLVLILMPLVVLTPGELSIEKRCIYRWHFFFLIIVGHAKVFYAQ